eukprot:6479060-Amphidinium_carterae.1
MADKDVSQRDRIIVTARAKTITQRGQYAPKHPQMLGKSQVQHKSDAKEEHTLVCGCTEGLRTSARCKGQHDFNTKVQCRGQERHCASFNVTKRATCKSSYERTLD